MKATFDLNFRFIPSFLISWIHINMETKRSCQSTASLCLLVIQISLLETKPKHKSRLHCIDINADLCIYNYTKNYPIPDCGGGALYFYV